MRRVFLACALLLQSGGNPVNIPVSTSAWQFGPGSRYDGANIIIGSGSKFSQVLTMSPADLQEYKPGYTITGYYTLTFTAANKFPSYPGYYTVEIDYGTQELCEGSWWGNNIFTAIPLVCTSPGYLIVDKSLPSSGPPQGQQKFAISFTSSAQAGWPILFENNVSLTFTPTN